MAINPDFRDLFAALNAAGADYVLVGGYAVSFHAVPRMTKDLDIFVRPSPENARKVMAALQSFGAPLADLSESDLSVPGTVFQIGIAPNRIDLLTAIDGVSFDEATATTETMRYAEQDVRVIGKAALLKNKLASGRPQDLLDAEALKK